LNVTVNGITQSYTLISAWKNEPVYFKAGAYHSAPDTGNPEGDATQISFSQITVTHP